MPGHGQNHQRGMHNQNKQVRGRGGHRRNRQNADSNSMNFGGGQSRISLSTIFNPSGDGGFWQNVRRSVRDMFSGSAPRQSETTSEMILGQTIVAEEAAEKDSTSRVMPLPRAIYEPPTARIDLEKCTGCGECELICPVGAIEIKHGHAVVNDECIGCRACECCCPEQAIEFKNITLSSGNGTGLSTMSLKKE